MYDKYLVPLIRKKSIKLDLFLPGSKSITNRALIISSLSNGKSELLNFLLSEDTIYMLKVLNELGIRTQLDELKRKCIIEGGILPAGDHNFFVGNAGTAMRFLTSYLSLGKGLFLLDGNERMRERPIEDSSECLEPAWVQGFCSEKQRMSAGFD